MTERPIIAILRGITPDEVVATCEALVGAGIGQIEVPLNTPNAIASIAAAQGFASRASIGAGTVLSREDVRLAAAAGARFIVSPDTHQSVIEETRALELLSFPGAFTATEAFSAIRWGATGLKMFPADLLGPAGIRALKAVLPPEIPVYAVGGAQPGNFAEYLAAGCTGFGIASYLYRPGMAAAETGRRAREVVEAFDRLAGR